MCTGKGSYANTLILQLCILCQDLSHCTPTGFKTLENRHKTLVFKDVSRLWEKEDPSLPWEKGEYNESNTLLLDDSPYKALLNPVRQIFLLFFSLFRLLVINYECFMFLS